MQWLDLGGGQHLGRDAAWDDSLQRAPVKDAAAVFVDEFGPRIADLDLVNARPVDVARNRDQARAGLFSVPTF